MQATAHTHRCSFSGQSSCWCINWQQLLLFLRLPLFTQHCVRSLTCPSFSFARCLLPSNYPETSLPYVQSVDSNHILLLVFFLLLLLIVLLYTVFLQFQLLLANFNYRCYHLFRKDFSYPAVVSCTCLCRVFENWRLNEAFQFEFASVHSEEQHIPTQCKCSGISPF